jgi:hypothetical protein
MTSSGARWRLFWAVLVTGLIATGSSVLPAHAAGGPNLAIGKAVSASASNPGHQPGAINDGNPNTYWEGPINAFPQWVQLDLGLTASIDQVVLKLPPAWSARTQTLSVSGSVNGSTFTVLSASAGRVFDPATANTVTIAVGPASVRYLRVTFTANTGWPAAQLGELEIYDAAGSTPNLAAGKTMAASSALPGYPTANANDGNRGTYWESTNNAWPQWLQVDLGATVAINRIVLRLPGHWGVRTETLAVQGSPTGASFTDLVTSAGYVFNQANANTVTISFPATTTRYVRLNITANTGQPGGQVAEFEVYGPSNPPTKPDLTVPAVGWSPTVLTEATPITLAATVSNIGGTPSTPTNVNFYVVPAIGPAILPPIVATAPVGALPPGSSVTVTAAITARAATTHFVTAKVDEANTVIEQNELNNNFTNPNGMVVSQLPASDIFLSQVSWAPTSPTAGQTVAFSVSIRNQGSIATTTGGHDIAVTITDSTGAVVHTTGGTYLGAIEPGAIAGPTSAGSWTAAAAGEYVVRIALVPDGNETPPRQNNNVGTWVLTVAAP